MLGPQGLPILPVVKFAKVEALGNDFILVEAQALRSRHALWARRLCDRRSGIGADGLLLVARGRGQLSVRIFNADGSEAELSGNGLRCVAAYAYRRGWIRGRAVDVRTRAGVVPQTLRTRRGRLLSVTSLLPAARLPARPRPPAVVLWGRRHQPVLVEVGNPHAVLEVDRFDPAAFRRVGALLERHRRFPQGVNVEFARRRSRGELEIWIWERGVGETQASGSGAAAAYAALRSRGRIGVAARVKMAGGDLEVAQRGGRIAVSGPAQVRFAGELL